MKIVIVGGVAGGASAAARIRRLSEQARDCHAGTWLRTFVRQLRPALLYRRRDRTARQAAGGAPVTAETTLSNRRTCTDRSRVIDRAAKTITVKELDSDRQYSESYDRLILSPGASPFRPPIPGIELPAICTLRDLRDADRLNAVAGRVPLRTDRGRWVHRDRNGREPCAIAVCRSRSSSWPTRSCRRGTRR